MRLFCGIWIFHLTFNLLSCFEYFEKSPSALLVFIQKDGIPKRISGRGVVLVPQGNPKLIPPGTIILSYKELVNMLKSGHVHSHMMGLYYYNIDEHYIGSERSSVKEIISWGRKTTNRNRGSARIILIPTSDRPSNLLQFVFNNVNRTLSYDYTTLTQILQQGKINRNSAAVLLSFEGDWYEQGSIIDLIRSYLKMNLKDKERSKFYLISDILGGFAKSSTKIRISSDKIENGYKVSEAHRLNQAETVVPDSYSKDLFGDVFNRRREIPYYLEAIPATSDVSMIPWWLEQMDYPIFGIQTQRMMIPLSLQDLTDGPISAGRTNLSPQDPINQFPRLVTSDAQYAYYGEALPPSFDLRNLKTEFDSPIMKKSKSRLSDSPDLSRNGLGTKQIRLNSENHPVMPWWHVRPKKSQAPIRKFVRPKPIHNNKLPKVNSKPQNKSTSLNGLVILFPKGKANSEGVIVVPDELSNKIDPKATKLLTVEDIFDMKAKDILGNSDIFIYFLPNENYTRITIGTGDVKSIITSKNSYLLNNWNRTRAIQISPFHKNQTLDIYNFRIFKETKFYPLNKLRSENGNESAIAIFEQWFTQDTVLGLIKWYHENQIAVPYVKVYYLKDLMGKNQPIATITVTPRNCSMIEIPLPEYKVAHSRKNKKVDSKIKEYADYRLALKSVMELFKNSPILVSPPERNQSDGVIFIPKTDEEGDVFFYSSAFQKIPRHITMGQLSTLWRNIEVDDTDIILVIQAKEANLTTVGELIPSIEKGTIAEADLYYIAQPAENSTPIRKVRLNKQSPFSKLKNIPKLLDQGIIDGYDKILIRNNTYNYLLETAGNLNNLYQNGQSKYENNNIYILRNQSILSV